MNNNQENILLDMYEDNLVDNENHEKMDKGNLLEYRIKRLFFAMGYYTNVGIIVKTSVDESADIITDLDVYGVYTHKNFANKRIWADCKAGKAKPLERISWLKGVRNTIHIDDVFFVKGSVRYATKLYAKKSGIIIVDTVMLQKLEQDYCINPNDWKGSWNPDTQINQLNKLKKIKIYREDEFKRIASFISSTYWVADDYAKVKKTITGIRQLNISIQMTTGDDKSTLRWALFQMISLFVLAVLNISKDIYYLSDREKVIAINEGLISGEISPNKRAEIAEATYKMAIGMVQQQIPDYKPVGYAPQIRIEPPEYSNKIIDLFNRITKSPLQYFDVLRMLDFMLMEYDLQNEKIDEKVMAERFENYDNGKISIKTFLHFLCDVCGVHPETFGILQI